MESCLSQDGGSLMLICDDCGEQTERTGNRQLRCPGCRLKRRKAEKAAAKRRAYQPAPPRPQTAIQMANDPAGIPGDRWGTAPKPVSRQTILRRQEKAVRGW